MHGGAALRPSTVWVSSHSGVQHNRNPNVVVRNRKGWDLTLCATSTSALSNSFLSARHPFSLSVRRLARWSTDVGRAMDDRLLEQLRQFYDGDAPRRRADGPSQGWKASLQQQFLDLVLGQRHGRGTSTETVAGPVPGTRPRLLDVGCGAGAALAFFRQAGVEAQGIDLSPGMVQACRDQGLRADVAEFSRPLPYADGEFDAIFSMNSMLHVPKALLPAVVRELRRILADDGVLFLGIYGGQDHEGPWEQDPSGSARFYSYYTDESLRCVLTRCGLVIRNFECVAVARAPGLHFQACTLTKRLGDGGAAVGAAAMPADV